jgi:signal transduction histidine kinase
MGMDFGKITMIGVISFCIILTLSAVLIYRNRVKRTMDRLDNILDRAISGSFTEHIYDESKLSALEAKLNRYLSICTVSSKNLSEEKDKIKALISDISHQTKTPLANILLYSQILLEKESMDTEKDNYPEQNCRQSAADDRDCIQQIYTQSEKLNFLISALVKISRLETGIISVVPEVNQVSRLITDSLEGIFPKAAAKQITIHKNECDGTACFDRKWTTEALYNILDNAVKYTPKGGSITVCAIPYELFYRINIMDNGIGIPEEEQSKIFGRFYRSAKVNQEEGVGIGLYIAREIILAQGGYIKVSSQPEKGSCFSVFLPKEL